MSTVPVSDKVLSIVCQHLGLPLVTKINTTGEDWWCITPHSGPDYIGTRAEIVAFVDGYLHARQHAKANLQRLKKVLKDHIGAFEDTLSEDDDR